MVDKKSMETKLLVFKEKEIRRTLHNDEWWFAIVDVVLALTDSADPRQYMKRMRQRDKELNTYWGTICTPLPLPAADGKMRKINCANTEGLFRIIQSIPSPKAELTDEWKSRGVQESPEYAILTAEISKAAFGMTPAEYKKHKGLNRQNLRDHMTDLELIFSMLGEAATTEIARKQDAQGFDENKVVSQKGGKIAGDSRSKLEIETGSDVVSSENYLNEPESQKRLSGRKNEI